MRKIILIGGAPTLGKSYLAKRIAEELRMTWISTDTIREQMREIVRKKDFPNLFMFTNASTEMARKYLTENKPKEIVIHQNLESKDVWCGVKAIIEKDYVWDDFIIEGVAVIPSLIAHLPANIKIVPIFLVDDDKERIKDTIFKRGLWDMAAKYPDDLKGIEVDWVIEFDKWIRGESEKHNYKIFEVGNRLDYIHEITKYVKVA